MTEQDKRKLNLQYEAYMEFRVNGSYTFTFHQTKRAGSLGVCSEVFFKDLDNPQKESTLSLNNHSIFDECFTMQVLANILGALDIDVIDTMTKIDLEEMRVSLHGCPYMFVARWTVCCLCDKRTNHLVYEPSPFASCTTSRYAGTHPIQERLDVMIPLIQEKEGIEIPVSFFL